MSDLLKKRRVGRDRKAGTVQAVLLGVLILLFPCVVFSQTVAANDDSDTTLEGTAVTVDVLGNDTIGGAAITDPALVTLTIVTPPSNGTAVVDSGNTITYTPNAGFHGTDSLVYQIALVSNSLDLDTATVTIEVELPTIEVPVDVKPGGCPNPLNVKSRGVFPVAILGTATFDVTTIDRASIRLAGVAPLRSSLGDAATPFEPFVGKASCSDCTEAGPDGYKDLLLKFDTQQLVAALGQVNDGDCVVLELTGNLKEEAGGNPILGEDVVQILKKGKGTPPPKPPKPPKPTPPRGRWK